MVKEKVTVEYQLILKEKIEDFEQKIKQFEIIMNHFFEQNPEVKYHMDASLYYEKFKEDIDNYIISCKSLFKNWNKRIMENMIKFLREAYRNLMEILNMLLDRKRILKKWNLKESFLNIIKGKKIDIIIDDMMKEMRDYIGYLEKEKDKIFA